MEYAVHNVQVRAAAEAEVIRLLREEPALCLFEYLVAPAHGGWVAVFPKRIDKGSKTAKVLSQRGHTDAFALRVFAKKVFLYEYFRNGEMRDQYVSDPAAYRRELEMDESLEEIVRRWETGEIDAAEYRELMAGYTEGLQGRVAAARARAAAAPAGGEKETVEWICAAVFEELKGREALKVIEEAIATRFPGRPEAKRWIPGTPGAGGGNPGAYPHLVRNAPLVEQILRNPGAPEETLAAFAGALGMPHSGLAFQGIDPASPGWTHLRGE